MINKIIKEHPREQRKIRKTSRNKKKEGMTVNQSQKERMHMMNMRKVMK